jgi:hypothetical protein
MKKLRLLPVFLTALIASAVLFGGWFGYRSLAMETPLSSHVNQIQGVTHSNTSITSNQVTINLTLGKDANLRQIVQQIEQDNASVIGNRSLQITVNNTSSPELEAWWSRVLFDVAQAMETKAYGDIPKALQAQMPKLPGLSATSEMDDHNVYIQLKLGDLRKDIILPRQPTQLGV